MAKIVIRLVIGLLFAIFGLFNYYTNVVENPITGEKQRVQISPKQEIVLGLRSREQLASEYGGLYPNASLQAYIDEIGNRLVERSEAKTSPYNFEFHLLKSTNVVNAFALPGGQVFITAAMLGRLQSEAQLAAVLGHEIGHVIARHGAEHLAKQQLGISLVNAVSIAASDGQQSSQQAAVLAQAVNQLVSLKYGREDELESDRLGLRFMTKAGYNPQGIVELMKILASLSGKGRNPEILSTHPDPGNRAVQMQNAIAQQYPNGIPSTLESGKTRFVQRVGGR
jgi:predicted Zn-dependent protease